MKVINLLIFILCVKCLLRSKFYFCFQGNWIIKRFNMNRAGVTQVSLLTLLNLPETCFPRNEHFEENVKGVSLSSTLVKLMWGTLCFY